jgi:hypothetical protein
MWELLVQILDKIKSRVNEIPAETIKSLLNLKVIGSIFSDFEGQKSYEREEGEYAKIILRDNTS